MKRILFVDDDPNVLDGLRRMLRGLRKTWQMSFCTSGAEALKVLDEQIYDAVVSDMLMPEMNGVDLLTAVRDRHPRTLRIILSGHSDQEMIMRSVSLAHQYLAKPCDADLLQQTIERSYMLREILHSERLEKLVGSIDALPSLPEQYQRLEEELNSADPSIVRIGGIIAEDLAMSAKILQLVNSAFFGLSRHVGNPVDAAKLLGTEVIAGLTLSMQLFSAFSKVAATGLDLNALTLHSLSVATLARSICQTEADDRKAGDHAFLAGMLHDTGKLILAQSLPDKYRLVLESDGKTTECEEQVFGVSHAEVGAYLFGSWGLPSPIVEAVALHHAPAQLSVYEMGPLLALHVANALVRRSDTNPTSYAALDQAYVDQAGFADRLPAWEAMIHAEATQ